MDAKIGGKKIMRAGHLHSLKVATCKMFINYKEKNSNFMIEKPRGHHLSQVNKASIISNNVYRRYAPYVYDAMRKARPFSGIPAQNV